MSEKVLYCQVDAHLDTNPKIVKAASGFATAVYQFFLRRVKVLGTDGWVPASNADPTYLARVLNFPEAEMLSALSTLVRCDLIVQTDTSDITITGWSDEWSGVSRASKRQPLSLEEKRERDRIRKDKERKAAKGAVHVSESVRGLSADSPLSEQSEDVRGRPRDQPPEERRSEKIRSSDLSHAPARDPRTPWERHAGWWARMREIHASLRAEGIQPNRHDLPAGLAPPHDKAIAACERNMLASGVAVEQLGARVEHALQVAAAEARRERHLDWFIPSKLWDPDRFARALDTTIEQAARPRPRGPQRPGAGPTKPTGRVEPSAPDDYPDGEIPL